MGSLSVSSLLLFVVVPVGYVALQVWALRTWEGVWKRTARFGLAVAVGLVAWVAVGFATGSDVWPLPLLLGVPVLFGSLVVLALARRLLERRTH